ncbi:MULTISPECIES: putative leader peptide [unclassified Pseudonocardia]|jgi:hypothetical protein
MRSTAERARSTHHPRYRRHVDLLRVTSAACPA